MANRRSLQENGRHDRSFLQSIKPDSGDFVTKFNELRIFQGRLVMDAIHDFSGKKTIIMIAHRLATVKQCDSIYLFENGKVTACGSYGVLLERNATFRDMAKHA